MWYLPMVGGLANTHSIKEPTDRQPKPKNNWFGCCHSKGLSLCYYFQAGTKKTLTMQPSVGPCSLMLGRQSSQHLLWLPRKKLFCAVKSLLHFSSDRLQGKCPPSVLCVDLIMNGLFMWPLYLFRIVCVPAKHSFSSSQRTHTYENLTSMFGFTLRFQGEFFLITD